MDPSSHVAVVKTRLQMFNVGQNHFPAVNSAFFFLNFLDIVFLSMK